MERRQRIHELVLALVGQQSPMDLIDHDSSAQVAAAQGNPSGWLERNRRLVKHYQALVRTAVTLDALIDQESTEHL